MAERIRALSSSPRGRLESDCNFPKQHRLYFFPEPQGQGSFRLGFTDKIQIYSGKRHSNWPHRDLTTNVDIEHNYLFIAKQSLDILSLN